MMTDLLQKVTNFTKIEHTVSPSHFIEGHPCKLTLRSERTSMQVVIGSARTSGKMESQAEAAMSKPLPKRALCMTEPIHFPML